MSAQAEADRVRRRFGYRPVRLSPSRCAWCGVSGDRLYRRRCVLCGATPEGESEGRGHGKYVVQLLGLAAGGSTAHDGGYLVEFDPHHAEYENAGTLQARVALAVIRTSKEAAQAMRFEDMAAARRETLHWDGWVRPDGSPSRPLTAFTTSLLPLDA